MADNMCWMVIGMIIAARIYEDWIIPRLYTRTPQANKE